MSKFNYKKGFYVMKNRNEELMKQNDSLLDDLADALFTLLQNKGCNKLDKECFSLKKSNRIFEQQIAEFEQQIAENNAKMNVMQIKHDMIVNELKKKLNRKEDVISVCNLNELRVKAKLCDDYERMSKYLIKCLYAHNTDFYERSGLSIIKDSDNIIQLIIRSKIINNNYAPERSIYTSNLRKTDFNLSNLANYFTPEWFNDDLADHEIVDESIRINGYPLEYEQLFIICSQCWKD